VLFDYCLQQKALSADAIHGYEQEEFTHMAVAVSVLSGRADAGMAIYSSAKALDLDFIPVGQERYDLVVPESVWGDFKFGYLLDVIVSGQFRRSVTSMGGYDTTESGKVMGIWNGEHWTQRA
jgi:putative molybdopterin biosynthesis protein